MIEELNCATSSSQSIPPGSRLLPYNLAIIGGGPAGTSIILRAMHLGFAHDLLNGKCSKELDHEGNSAGVCIFDCGAKNRFGGGKLQDYQINSNTNGAKFVTNLTQDRPNVLPPEIATGTELEQVGKTKLAQNLLDYRATTAPLYQIGQFLVEVGKVVLDFFDSHPQSTYYCSTEVIKIQQTQIKNQNIWKIISRNLLTKSISEVYARYVVLASGGKQTLPKLPNIPSTKLYSSDYICTTSGIQELINKLRNYPRKRIVIIGGSHSAFSAAWICLNKLGWYKESDSPLYSSINSNNTNSSTNTSSNHSIYIVHRHEIKVFYACKKDADRDKYVSYEGINKQGQIHPFSGLRGDAKALYRNIKTGTETRVRLLAIGPDGTNHQSLYTRLCEEAQVIIWACGYEASLNYSIVDANDIPLPIYIKRGQVEINDLAQVQIMTPPTPSSLATSTVQSPGKALIPLVPQETPVPIGNLLATGLGFGLNVSGDTSSATSLCKADGVAVYLKRAATLILSHVLGPKVFGEGLLTWEQHVVENVRRWNEQQALIRAMKNQTDSNDLEDSDLEINTSGILSPIHPSRGENKRSVTPSTRSPTAPLVTSPIRRQIRTASSSDISRKKTREGTQLGVSNTSHQKKIPASPVTTSTKKTNPPVEQASTKNQTILQLPLPTVMTKTVNALDNADTDPFDLYLSGVASSSLDNSDNQQNIPPQFSPLQSPKDTLQSADTGDDAPPPPYPVEEFNALSHRPVSQCRSSRDRSSSQESQSNCSTSRSIPLSLSTPITPRNLLVEPTIGRDLSHHPQTPTGWIAPSQSVLSPTIPSSSKTQRVKDPSLSNSVPEKVRATFASPPPNTLHLSSSGLSSQRPTQIKSTGNLPQSSSPFLTSVLGVQPPLHLLPALKLAPSQLSKDKSFHSNRQPVQKSTETSHSHSRTLASLQGVKKLLVAKSSKVS